MLRKITSVTLTLILILILLASVSELPEFGSVDAPMNNHVIEKYNKDSIEETGSFNVVTAIVLDYRGFDTLIEATVLFCAAIIIIIVLRKQTGELANEESHSERS